jgi:hypothetical protein
VFTDRYSLVTGTAADWNCRTDVITDREERDHTTFIVAINTWVQQVYNRDGTIERIWLSTDEVPKLEIYRRIAAAVANLYQTSLFRLVKVVGMIDDDEVPTMPQWFLSTRLHWTNDMYAFMAQVNPRMLNATELEMARSLRQLGGPETGVVRALKMTSDSAIARAKAAGHAPVAAEVEEPPPLPKAMPSRARPTPPSSAAAAEPPSSGAPQWRDRPSGGGSASSSAAADEWWEWREQAWEEPGRTPAAENQHRRKPEC